MMMCGGFSQANQPDETIVAICNDIKPHVEAHLNSTYTVFEPVSYTSQVVAGTNFLIKVKVGEDEHISIKVHRPLPCNGTELKLMEAGPTQ